MEPRGLVWGLKAGGGDEIEKKEKKEKKEEKISHMCDSIGHRLFRGRCPKSKIRLIKENPDRALLMESFNQDRKQQLLCIHLSSGALTTIPHTSIFLSAKYLIFETH